MKYKYKNNWMLLVYWYFLLFVFFSIVCRGVINQHSVKGNKLPQQSLYAHRHHYSYPSLTIQQSLPRPPVRCYSGLSRLPLRRSKLLSLNTAYRTQRNFWVARLASRLLKLRYLVLGSAVGGGYTAKKVCVVYLIRLVKIKVVLEPNSFFTSRQSVHQDKKPDR